MRLRGRSIKLPAAAAAGLIAVLSVGAPASARATPQAAGQWAQFQGTAAHTGAEPGEDSITSANVGQLSQVWTAALPASYNETEVAVSGGVVYAAGGGTVTALSAATGAQLWQQTVADHVAATPTVADGLVFVTTLHTVGHGYFGNLWALNAATGAKVWFKKLSTYPYNGQNYNESVTVAGATAYVDVGGSVVAYRARTGKRLWTSPGLPGCQLSAPSVADGYVVVGSGGTSVTALRASDGTVAWQQTFLGDCALGGPTWTPAISGGTVYAGLSTGLVSFSLTTGAIGFQDLNQGEVYLPMSLIGGKVVFTGKRGHLSAVSQVSGDPAWAHTSKVQPDGPVASFGHLIWLTKGSASTSQLVAVAPATGRVVYRSAVYSSAGTAMPPVVDAGHVYVNLGTEVVCLGLPG